VTGPGAVQVSGTAGLDVTGAARADSLAIAGGTLALPGGAALDVTGTLANAGTVRLADATLTAGAYTQAAGATLAEALGGGVLSVRGAAALDGTLAFDRGGGVPDDGATFPVIRYGSLSGAWATVAVAPLAGVTFPIAYGAGAASLSARHIPAAPTPAPTVTPTPTVTDAATPTPVPPPPAKPGVRGVVTPVRGTVVVRLPPASPGAPATVVPLVHAASLPVGSVVDARKGQVTLTTASSFTNPGRSPTTISVSAGIFRIRQVRATDGHTAVTDLIVRTPPGLAHACTAPHKGVARRLARARPRASHRTIRHLHVVAKGIVRAFGRVGVLTTHKATFDLRDRCDGTAARVTKGRASLFDRIHGGQSQLRAARHARHARLIRARLFTAHRLHLKRVPRARA
jgi:hypothetical protein